MHVHRAALAALLAPALSGCYLVHVAAGQLDVACSTIGIEEALASPDLSDADKQKLRLVQEIREFAERELRLDETDNYTGYLPGEKKPLTWVVSASERLRLRAVTWWFPIIGSVSYKGFFDKEWAESERDRLIAKGYDAYVRPAAAYSTLGWFDDPVTPLMLGLTEDELALLIIHELMHSTVYVSDRTEFNESLAEFVGREGARAFLDRRYGPDNPHSARLRDRLDDERRFDEFLNGVSQKLIALYASDEPDRLARRNEIFDRTKREFADLRKTFKVAAYDRFAQVDLNNAVIIANLTYGNYTPFERAFEGVGRDWSKFIDLVKRAGDEDDPYEFLRRQAP